MEARPECDINAFLPRNIDQISAKSAILYTSEKNLEIWLMLYDRILAHIPCTQSIARQLKSNMAEMAHSHLFANFQVKSEKPLANVCAAHCQRHNKGNQIQQRQKSKGALSPAIRCLCLFAPKWAPSNQFRLFPLHPVGRGLIRKFTHPRQPAWSTMKPTSDWVCSRVIWGRSGEGARPSGTQL